MSSALDVAPADRNLRLEALIVMGARLIEAVDGDIAALESGNFAALRTSDPEIARLAAQYAREVAELKRAGGVRNAPERLVDKLRETVTRLMDLLVKHERLVAAMREASEGLIQTVAEEIEKQRNSAAPYTPVAHVKRAPVDAIVYNKVV